MKTLFRFSTIAICIVLALVSATSCKKTSNNTTSMGTFYFHLHTNIDTNEVDDTTAFYKDATGRRFGLQVAQFYVTSVTVHNVTGSSYTISNAIVLKSIDSEEYLIGQAPVGTYDQASFTIGLDATTNSLSPTSFTTTGYAPNSSMWFGSTANGFMFMKVQGFADTTAAQNGTYANAQHFSYEIGSSANLKTVSLPVRSAVYPPYILTKGGVAVIHVICDYGKLLNGINFKTQDSTDTYTVNPTLAGTIANNIPGMFYYEE